MPVVYGFHPVREALRHDHRRVVRVFLSVRDSKRRREILSLCELLGVPEQVTDDATLVRLGGANHQGFIAEMVETARRSEALAADPDLVVLLEDVQDPRNLGALLRVCEGAGVGRVLIRDRGSAPLSPAAVKASAGAAEWIDTERITNPARELEQLKAGGYWIYGAAAGGDPPWRHDLSGKVVLCFGGEEKGLRRRTLATCDVTLGLPMRGRVASLNVATAAAAILYEVVRQRVGSGAP